MTVRDSNEGLCKIEGLHLSGDYFLELESLFIGIWEDTYLV